MVNLVVDWNDVERYTAYMAQYKKPGSYQLGKSDGNVVIRVSIGPYGYVKEFKQAEDPELIKILAFCQGANFIRVSGSLKDDAFYA